jgi:hypothetical protein
MSSLQHCTLESKLVNVVKIMKDSNCGAFPIIDRKKKVSELLQIVIFAFHYQTKK